MLRFHAPFLQIIQIRHVTPTQLITTQTHDDNLIAAVAWSSLISIKYYLLGAAPLYVGPGGK